MRTRKPSGKRRSPLGFVTSIAGPLPRCRGPKRDAGSSAIERFIRGLVSPRGRARGARGQGVVSRAQRFRGLCVRGRTRVSRLSRVDGGKPGRPSCTPGAVRGTGEIGRCPDCQAPSAPLDRVSSILTTLVQTRRTRGRSGVRGDQPRRRIRRENCFWRVSAHSWRRSARLVRGLRWVWCVRLWKNGLDPRSDRHRISLGERWTALREGAASMDLRESEPPLCRPSHRPNRWAGPVQGSETLLALRGHRIAIVDQGSDGERSEPRGWNNSGAPVGISRTRRRGPRLR